MNRRQNSSRGFVLVNALVLVAALSAVAVLLLARAESGRARLQAGQEADQLALALDAFDALAITLLAQDRSATDHPGEAWARVQAEQALARGAVSGRIEDLQGRFNVNWLADPDNTAARAAFARLLKILALPPRTGETIRAALQPGGPQNRAAWARLDPPLDPVGGALLDAGQLAGIPGLPPRSYQRLRPYITALPGSSRLNVNTASPQVLAAFLPHLPPAALARLQTALPAASPEAFLAAAGLARISAEQAPEQSDETAADHLGAEQITVVSHWFRASSQAQLGTLSAQRSTVLRKTGAARRPAVAWRLTRRP
ncbi:type II secretion system minor pseudopilin GspK [Leisingera sp. NJS204]|uniref:type II secretion system minor pseudopilin GspK n=1 Tax=Leisingera sp. NJS204 TaxID=2508307 RepID=UPI001011D574|nr:type II secretion system minor pseudopilin GspK [Leisingera sp. NJS204]QAX32069.1 hypothetical protein ETW24_22015 [Leisingera sp. NJS204]